MKSDQQLGHLSIKQRARRVMALFKTLLGYRQVLMTVLSSFSASLLELLGIAVVFPFIKLVTDRDFHAKVAQMFADTPAYGVMQDHSTSVVIVGTLLILAFLCKAVLHTLLIRYQSNMSARITAMASERFIDSALNARYQLFQEHGGVKIAGLSYSNTAHAALLFQFLVTAANEFVFIMAVLITTGILYPWLGIAILALTAVVASSIFIPLSRKTAALGRQTNELDIARHHFVFALANSIRDIKIMGLESPFALRNSKLAEAHANLAARHVTIGSILRTTVETLLFCGIVVGGIYVGMTKGNLVELAPVLATAALVAARSAPALSRLVASYNGFRYSLPFVEHLMDMESEIKKFEHQRKPQAIEFSRDYMAEGVNFHYGSQQVLDKITIKIPAGKVVAIVGPSGAGKSTLLDLLSGLQPASVGRFILDGIPFDPFVCETFSKMIGYVPQAITLLDTTLEYNITLDEEPDPKRLQNALRGAHLTDFVAALPNGLNTMLGEGGLGVSGGQRQRIGIARALYRSPRLLILDEVTSALDAVTEKAVMDELWSLRGETSLLMVTHRLSSVTAADNIYLIDQGRVVASGTHQILLDASSDYRALYFSQIHTL